MEHILSFVLSKETKGALQYKETQTNGVPSIEQDGRYLVGTIYLRKAMLGEFKPEFITIKVEC